MLWGATQTGAELDLLIVKDGRSVVFEFKHTDYFKMTFFIRIALETWQLITYTLSCPMHKIAFH